MSRNAAILALAGSVAAGLLILRWGMPAASDPEEPPSLSPSPLLASSNEAVAVIDEADPRSGEDAPGPVIEGKVLAVNPERREAPTENKRIDDRRHEPMRLVTGFVRDVGGRPVEDAVVIVTERGAPDPPRYRVPILASGRSDEGGRFAIWTTVHPVELEARASKAGFLDSRPAPFRPGAEGLALVLDPGGVVCGRLVLDPWVRLVDVAVEIDAPSPMVGSTSRRTLARSRGLGGFPEQDSSGYVFEIDGEGRFAATGFAASTVDVRVRAAEEPWEAICIRDVAVRRPGERSDTRLDPLDLRGTFELLAVDVLDDSGNELSGARVTLRNSDVAAEGRSQFTLGGRTDFLTRAGPHDIEIESEGFRSAHLAAVSGDQVVRLRKEIAVHVRLRGSSARPAPPDLLAVGFLREGPGRMRGSRPVPITVVDGMGTFDDPRQTTISVASAGIHQIAWYVRIGNIEAYLQTGPIATVDIRDQEAVQEIVLDLPAQAEAAWIDRQQSLGGSRPEGASNPR